MTGDFGDLPEALGEAVQGGMAARAVEPDAGGSIDGGDGHTQEQACLNCGTVLMGAHCHSCGQRAHVHRTLRAFLHDLVHGVLHFEGKFWRTLPLLAWRPGQLIREYIGGKRASYISPIALFLFTVFVSFAVFNAAGGFGEIKPSVDPATRAQMEASVAEANSNIAELEAELNTARQAGQPLQGIEERLSEARAGKEMLTGLLAASTDGSSIVKITTPEADDEGSAVSAEVTAARDDSGSEIVGGWLRDTWAKAKANPKLLLYKLQTNAYKLSWLLIPLSLPFVWLMFPFSRKFRMYDHTVFVTYSISFMTMMVLVASFGIAYEIMPLVAGPVLYAPFHLYRSLCGAYSLTRFGALVRTILLSIGCWASMILFSIIMISIVISG